MLFKVIPLIKRSFSDRELEMIDLLLASDIFQLIERDDYLVKLRWSDSGRGWVYSGTAWSDQYDIFLEPGLVFINIQKSSRDYFSLEWDSECDSVDELWDDGIAFILREFSFKQDVFNRITALLKK